MASRLLSGSISLQYCDIHRATESIDFDGFDVQGDLDLRAHHNPSVRHRVLPVDAEVETIDPRSRDKPGARFRTLVDTIFPPGRLPTPEITDIERDGAGDVADGEVAANLVIVRAHLLNARAFKANLRVRFTSKKIVASQVIVAHLHARPAGRRVDRRFYGEDPRVRRVEFERPGDVLERAAHPGDHHVPRPKLCGAMSGFKKPFHGAK
jgi:hypothetical protein